VLLELSGFIGLLISEVVDCVEIRVGSRKPSHLLNANKFGDKKIYQFFFSPIFLMR
jgi:hypothetical protein